MRTWAVPTSVLEDLMTNVLPLVDEEGDRAQAAFRSLLEIYDYWESYVAIHNRTMKKYVLIMLGFLFANAISGVWSFFHSHVYAGVFFGGVAGGLLSIISKMPPVMGVGETNAYQLRIFGRLGIGLASSIIGMGLLAANVITVNVNQTTIANILNKPASTPEERPTPQISTPSATKGSASTSGCTCGSGSTASSGSQSLCGPISAGPAGSGSSGVGSNSEGSGNVSAQGSGS